MKAHEYYEQKQKRLSRKIERLEIKKNKAVVQEEKHDASIARDLAGVPGHFAHGINFYKLFWIFFLCCFLGVVIETLFCFVTTGEWMQRTGLVWGSFNLIYGIGAVLLTVALQVFLGKSDRWIYFGGAVIGGAFEYFCSWLQETILGTVSWDYSGYLFNLNGRINLLYCQFWGILALFWLKEAYPRLNGWIERGVSNRYGIAISWILIAFMVANSFTSGVVVLRQAQRYEEIPAMASWQTWCDTHYPDEVLADIYPSMQRVDLLV